jgi:ABC-type spermidine/putrescine transport system permease subunit II
MDASVAVGLLVFLIAAVLVVAMLKAYANIFGKAGYSRWLCLTMLVPLVNIGVLLWFGFSKWPAETELERLRAGSHSGSVV